MQLTITIKDKDVVTALKSRVEWDIINDYSDAALKALGVTRASALDVLVKDAKFMATVEKDLVRSIETFVGDVLDDIASDVTSPELKKLQAQLDKAEKVVDKADAAERKLQAERLEQERLLNTIKFLTDQGYKITKE